MVTEIRFPEDIVEENREQLTEVLEDEPDEFADEIIDTALMILDVWDPSARGKAPTGVAATVIYVADRVGPDKLTQQEVCDVVDSSPMTIRKQQADCMTTAREEGVV